MPKNKREGVLSFITDSPSDTIWEQLSAFESFSLSKRFVERRSDEMECSLSPDVIENKAIALAYCIRNAKEYMRLPNVSMTVTATANYYGCLWLCSAVAVANPSSGADLAAIETSTKNGHGLGNIGVDSGKFPNNEYIYLTDRGFLKSFLQWTSLSSEQFKDTCWTGKRPSSDETFSAEKQRLLVPITDLLARIPELTGIFEEVTGLDAKNFELFHARNSLDLGRRNDDPGISVIGICGDYSRAHIADCMLPLSEINEYKPSNNGVYSNSRWAGLVTHRPHAKFFDTIYENPADKTYYVSPLSNYYFIAPTLTHIKDPLALHLMLSYQLSILARYRPAIWREIVEGSLDKYRILIASYNRLVARVIPHIVLSAIIGRRVRVPLPGVW